MFPSWSNAVHSLIIKYLKRTHQLCMNWLWIHSGVSLLPNVNNSSNVRNLQYLLCFNQSVFLDEWIFLKCHTNTIHALFYRDAISQSDLNELNLLLSVSILAFGTIWKACGTRHLRACRFESITNFPRDFDQNRSIAAPARNESRVTIWGWWKTFSIKISKLYVSWAAHDTPFNDLHISVWATEDESKL